MLIVNKQTLKSQYYMKLTVLHYLAPKGRPDDARLKSNN